MKVIIDRFEEDLAVVELDGEMLNAPRALFAGANEGDTVELTVLPRTKAEDIPAEDQASLQSEKTDEPAAIFAKLRRKRRRR